MKYALDPVLRAKLPSALVLVICCWVVYPYLFGDMPVTVDHPVHYFKAWSYWTHFILEGRFSGWSNFWFFGYPVNELYPPGPDLWMASFRALSLGHLSWETSYAIAFACTIPFTGLGLFKLSQQLIKGWWAVLAPAFWALDVGANNQGGWTYHVHWGVWGQMLATGFFAWGLAAHLGSLKSRHANQICLVAVLFYGLAMCTHLVTVIVLPIVYASLLLSYLMFRRHDFNVQLLRSLAITPLLGISIASFYFLPFLALKNYSRNIGNEWISLSEMLLSTLDGSVLERGWPLLVHFAIITFLTSLIQRRQWPSFIGLAAYGMMLLATADSAALLGAIHPVFSNIQYPRLLIPAKPLLYILATYGLWQCSIWIQHQPKIHISMGAKILLPAILPIFLLVLDAQNISHKRTELETINSSPWYPDMLQLAAHLNQEKDNTDDFFRVAYWLTFDDHRLMGLPVLTGLGIHRYGYTPCKLFKYCPQSIEPELLQVLSVKYLITDKDLPESQASLISTTHTFKMYEMKNYSPQRYTMTGPGTVDILHFGDESIRLKLSGTGTKSRLKLHVSEYVRWVASMNGETLPISKQHIYKPTRSNSRLSKFNPEATRLPMLMEVPVEDGVLEFSYQSLPVDRAGRGLSAATFIFVIGLGFRRCLINFSRTRRHA